MKNIRGIRYNHSICFAYLSIDLLEKLINIVLAPGAFEPNCIIFRNETMKLLNALSRIPGDYKEITKSVHGFSVVHLLPASVRLRPDLH